jgi:hypothetical protein
LVKAACVGYKDSIFVYGGVQPDSKNPTAILGDLYHLSVDKFVEKIQ